MSVADEIRKALSSDRRPASEIAGAADIHVINLYQFKSGSRDLPLATLERLARVLGLKITTKKAAKK